MRYDGDGGSRKCATVPRHVEVRTVISKVVGQRLRPAFRKRHGPELITLSRVVDMREQQCLSVWKPYGAPEELCAGIQLLDTSVFR